MPKSYHPPTTLKAALAIPKTLFEKNAGNPWFRVRVAQELNMGAEGDAFRQLVTASRQYGLTTGSARAKKITLEPRGNRIIGGDLDAVYEALFSVGLFKSYYEHFSSGGTRGLPSETAAKDFLTHELKVPDRQVDRVMANILANARDWYLIQDIAGGKKFVPRELARQTAADANAVGPFRSLAPTPEPIVPTGTTEKPTEASVQVVPKLQLNIEIHIAPDTSEDKIEAIFRNMRKYLLPNER